MEVRLSVVRDLPRTGTTGERARRLELLIESLQDREAALRREALLALADFDATEAISQVLPLLDDVEIRVRQMAIVCLGELAKPGDPVVMTAIRPLLDSEDARIRYQVLLAICQILPDKASKPIVAATRDPDPEVRELSLRLTDEILLPRGETLESDLQKYIRAACVDQDQGVRVVAQIVSGQLGWATPRDMLLQIVRRRVKVREARDEQMAILLCGRLEVREAIPNLSRRAYGWFGFSLDHFRWTALGALARLGDERAWSRLGKALKAPRSIERSVAVQTLGEVGRPRALALLEELRGNDTAVDQELLLEALEKSAK